MSLDRIRTELNDEVLRLRRIGAACQNVINDRDGAIEKLINGAIHHVDELRDNIEATLAYQQAQEETDDSSMPSEARTTEPSREQRQQTQTGRQPQRQQQGENRSQRQEQHGGGDHPRLVAGGVISDRDRAGQRQQERREAGAEIPSPDELNYGPTGPRPGESVSEKIAQATGKMPLAGVIGGREEPPAEGEYPIARSGNVLGVNVGDEGGPGEDAGGNGGRGRGGQGGGDQPGRTKSGKIDLRTVRGFDRRMGEKPSEAMPDQVG